MHFSNTAAVKVRHINITSSPPTRHLGKQHLLQCVCSGKPLMLCACISNLTALAYGIAQPLLPYRPTASK